MKINVKLFSLAFVAAALVLTGCTKKPVRPSPDQTVFGPQTGGTVTPIAVETPIGAGSLVADDEPISLD